ncbi:MAG: hypothetical protein ACK55Z_12665, partial [bacterium]
FGATESCRCACGLFAACAAGASSAAISKSENVVANTRGGEALASSVAGGDVGPLAALARARAPRKFPSVLPSAESESCE